MNILKELFKKNLSIILIFLILELILLRLDYVTPMDFDSSYNLIIVRTFNSTRIYGSDNYILPGQKIFPFDTWITTGYPLLLLTAFLTKILGFNFFIPRILMNLFFLIFIFLVWLIMSSILKLKKKITLNLLLIIIIFLTFILNIHYLGIHTLGEIPATVFFLIGILINKLNEKNSNFCFSFLFGLLLGLSYLTKLIFIFLTLPYVLLISINLYIKNKLKKIVSVIFGFLTPLIFYLIWINQYIPLLNYYNMQKTTWLTQNINFKVNTFFNLNKLIINITNFINFDPIFILLILIFLYFSFYIKSYKKFRNKEFLALNIFFLYLIFSGNHLNNRHIIVFKFFLLLFFSSILIFNYKSSISNNLKQNYKKIVFSIIFLSVLSIITIINSLKMQPFLATQKIISNIIRKDFKNKTIYFWGWWKVPDIQILSERNFILYDEKNHKFCKNDCFLIIDPLMKSLAPTDTKLISEKFIKPVFSYLNYDFYKLR